MVATRTTIKTSYGRFQNCLQYIKLALVATRATIKISYGRYQSYNKKLAMVATRTTIKNCYGRFQNYLQYKISYGCY